MADSINGSEYEAFTTGKRPDLAQKQNFAAALCASRMSVDDQPSPDKKLKVEAENKCINEFHPEHTDYSGTYLRDRFCGCYAVFTTKPGSEAKSPKDARAFCLGLMGITRDD